MRPYRILYGTRRDALRAENRLEREHPGYGPAFANEFRSAVLAVLSQPQMYPRTADGPEWLETREFFIQRFNYRVIYAFDGEEVVFVAVHHAHRRPGSWRRRLSDLS
jgi:hypothetical protein